jgi:hypothetical protein
MVLLVLRIARAYPPLLMGAVIERPIAKTRPTPGWESLPEAVRRAHEPGSFVGCFEVRRGEGLLARFVAGVSRFPPPGRDVRARLTVTEKPDGTRWARRFGERDLVTTQRVLPGGLTAERLGCFECVFRLRLDERGVAYDQVAAALTLGPLRVPLPLLLAPRVESRVEAASGGRACRVSVAIAVPIAGFLLSYEGIVSREEVPA